jgi:Protein of unknown function (DUF2510)
LRSDEQRPDAAGWYPDPDTGRMRRWDGSQWTGESRDMPPWMATKTGVDRPAGRRNFPRRWIITGAVVGFLFLAVSFQALNSGVDLPDRTVDDAEFITAANAQCRSGLQPLKEARPRPGTPEGRDPGPDEKVAGTVDEAADRISSLSVDLREMASRSIDEADLQAWLTEWERYADIGHRYADAVREGRPEQRGLATEGEASRRRADLFAQANGLKDCTFA